MLHPGTLVNSNFAEELLTESDLELRDLVYNESEDLNDKLQQATRAEIAIGHDPKGRPYDPRLAAAFAGEPITTTDTRATSSKREKNGSDDRIAEKGDTGRERGIGRLARPPTESDQAARPEAAEPASDSLALILRDLRVNCI